MKLPRALAIAPALCLFAACAPAAVTVRPALPTFRTLTEEHRARVVVTPPGQPSQQRTLRGLIAIERPDRLRLRALGPGGILLFDVVSVAGKSKVLSALRDPRSSVFGKILEAMVADLRAAYDLEPRSERKVSLEADMVRIEEPGRVVLLRRFAQIGKTVLARSLYIENRAQNYTVEVEVTQSDPDAILQPEMFP